MESNQEDFSIVSNNLNLRKLLRKYKKQILLAVIGGLVAAGINLFLTLSKKPIYPAELTYMVNEDEGSQLGNNMLSMLGKFGMGGSTKFNLEKIVSLSKSENIIRKSLLAMDSIDGKKDFYANHLIDLYDLNKENKLNVRYTQSDFDKFNIQEKRMLKIIHELLVGKDGLMNTEVDLKTGIMTQTITTLDPRLSVSLSLKNFDELSKFYIEKSISKEANSYNVIKRRVDSLYRIMNNKEYTKAEIDDKSIGVWQEVQRTPSRLLDRDMRITSLMYGEAVKNMELAYFSLKTKTPFIQVIDQPYVPIKEILQSKIKAIAIGFSIGFLTILLALILFRRS